MPGRTYPKGAAISLVQDQDIEIVDVDKSDLTITVIGAAEEDCIKHVTDVLVSKDVCMSSSYLQAAILASDDPSEIVLGGQLKRGANSKHGKDEGENLEGLLVVLAHLHSLTESSMQELGLYSLSILGVWYAIAYMEREQANTAKSTLKTWFNRWYASSMQGVELTAYVACAMAYPCQIFDHAKGFAHITKWLAYNHIGHVKEFPPKGFYGRRDLHLPPSGFVGPVNHARGGLKTTLHKSLYKKCGHLLRHGTKDCTCWAACVGEYFAALTKIDVFPVDDVLSYSSIQQICHRLKDFKYDHKPDCRRCSNLDWKTVVLKARGNTEAYFQGVCLDCMDRSKPVGGNIDEEYWAHNESVDHRWDTKCRIDHGQSSWYVSWLGRPDIREKLMRGVEGYKEDD